MANYLDANPSEVETLNHHRADPCGLVPVVRNGILAAMVNRRAINRLIQPSPLPAMDYVVGLEVLGFRLWVSQQDGGTVLSEMTPVLDNTPACWFQMAEAIKAGFGEGRLREVVDFLQARDGEAL